jgi:recombination protein RecA
MQRTDDAKTTSDPKAARAAQAEALDDAILNIEKAYGKGAIMRLGQQPVAPVAGISTGSLALDLGIGGCGLPRGRIVEIFGPESSGKTTLTLHVVANAQKDGGTAAFIDAEHALDPQYARKLGVDLESLLISQPDNGEQALDICETLVRSGALDVIVIDSVAALVPKAEIEGEMGDSFVGLQARLMSQALRKLTALTARSRTCLIFINQIREKIGVMFGSPETTTGGRALKFYSSVRLDIRRIGQIKDGDEAVGNRTKVTVVKNKIAPPFRKVEFDILFNRGIDQVGELLDIGVERGVLKRSGTWLSLGDTRLGQGRERAREFLDQNPEMLAQVRQQVAKAAAPPPPAASPIGADAADKGGAGAGKAPAPGSTTPPAAEPARGRVPPAAANAENGSGARSDKPAPARK